MRNGRLKGEKDRAEAGKKKENTKGDQVRAAAGMRNGRLKGQKTGQKQGKRRKILKVW